MNRQNSRILNSILPASILPANAPATTYPSIQMPNMSSVTSMFSMTYVMIAVAIGVTAALIYLFKTEIERGWSDMTSSIGSLFNAPKPVPVTPLEEKSEDPSPSPSRSIGTVVEKVLPSSGKEVFNVSSNKYSYYDAEPLCKALGAELATYDQVKEAWSKGADWCNYGWVKGQMAVYPTSQETYDKTQNGADAGDVCGQVGVNGGYFDNPELRYGVTCYGKKPANTLKNASSIERNTPTSPDALAFDKKVAEFKRQASTISILPKNSHSWE